MGLGTNDLYTAGQSRIVHALVETITKGQALQAAGQSRIVHALVEIFAKGQALQTAGQSHIVHALVEPIAKGQALQLEPNQMALQIKIMHTVTLIQKPHNL